MAKFINPLDRVKIAAPCSADWDQMYAFEHEKVKFCSQCNLNVYNLSGMTRTEAEALLTSTEGRLCVRFYRRPDGTILTQNCPIGLRAIKRRIAWLGQVIHGMVLSFLFVLGLHNLAMIKRHLDAYKYDSQLDPPQLSVVMGGMFSSPTEVGPTPKGTVRNAARGKKVSLKSGWVSESKTERKQIKR